jgi:Flp pilus assembly pilin Flp
MKKSDKKSQRGANLFEYAILVSLLIIFVMASIRAFTTGVNVDGTFSQAGTAID